MGDISMEIMLPVPVAAIGIFLGICVLYFLYSAAKFIISLWTGA